jgi:cyclic pyranopterin monophosphate synthase
MGSRWASATSRSGAAATTTTWAPGPGGAAGGARGWRSPPGGGRAPRAPPGALVAIEQATLSAIIDGTLAKGEVLTIAEMAGVMGGKRTAELIPLCHPIPLTDLAVEIRPEREQGGLRIRATAATVAQTGVEMEALTAAAVAALTVYDMVKGVDRSAAISEVRLLEKTGGRSGDWKSEAPRRTRSSRGPRRTG